MALDLRQPEMAAFPIPIPTSPHLPHPLHQAAVEQVIAALHQRIHQPLALAEMADIACLSPFHFNRVFRRIVGIPPYEFLATLRLDAARRLLLTTDASITDVCFALGYGSLGTFTTRFTQRIGMSPGQLRRVAEAFSVPSRATSDALAHDRATRVLRWRGGGRVAGRVLAPADGFDGLIFAGLFRGGIPQGRPVAGTLLTAPGAYHLVGVPDGVYHLLVAGVPHTAGARAYLLPGMTVLVGTREQTVVVRGGRAAGPCDIWLRPARLTDPPVLVSLPFLLA